MKKLLTIEHLLTAVFVAETICVTYALLFPALGLISDSEQLVPITKGTAYEPESGTIGSHSA